MEESLSSFDSDSDDLSIEECVKNNRPEELKAAGLQLENSSVDSIDEVIDDFYFKQQSESKLSSNEALRKRSNSAEQI